jgi:hypothetical protein
MSSVGGNKSPLASPLRKKSTTINNNTNTTTKIRKKKKKQPSQQLTKHDVEMAAVDEEIHTSDTTNNTTDDTTQLNNTSSYGGMGGMNSSMMMSPYSMGMGGMGMMGGMYGGMGMGMGMGMGSQWLTSLNQCLFGFQSLIFSLGQAVQIVGMNAQQLHHVYDSLKGMIENAVGQVNSKLGCSIEELLGVNKNNKGNGRSMLGNNNNENQNSTSTEEEGDEDEIITQNEIIRRRRVAAFRWTISLATSYLLYKGVRKLIRTLIFGGDSQQRHSPIQQQQQYQGSNGYSSSGQYGNGSGGYGSGMNSGSYGMSRYSSGGYGRGGGYGQRQYHDQGYSDIDRGGYY